MRSLVFKSIAFFLRCANEAKALSRVTRSASAMAAPASISRSWASSSKMPPGSRKNRSMSFHTTVSISGPLIALAGQRSGIGPRSVNCPLQRYLTAFRLQEPMYACPEIPHRITDLSRAERKRTSGAEQNRTTERHVVKHQGPGGVRARFRQLPEVGWTSCCA